MTASCGAGLEHGSRSAGRWRSSRPPFDSRRPSTWSRWRDHPCAAPPRREGRGPGGRHGVRAEPRRHGVFEVTVPGLDKIPDYRLRITYPQAPPYETDDPYRHWPTLGELDLHLIGEGRHERLWEALGARVMRHEDVDGTAFTVWAPNARGVRVIGDFNHWDGVAIRCVHSADRASGSCSSRRSGRAAATSSRSSAWTGSGGRRPTPWPAAPRCRRPPPPSSSGPSTSGTTRPGCRPGRTGTRAPSR